VRPGPESFLGEDRGDPVRFAHAVVDAGADLVLGTGPHVLRGLEWYGGRLIAYSLGSCAGYRTLSIDGILGVSAVLHVSLRADGSWASGDLAAVRLIGNGTPEPDPEATALRLVAELSQEDFGGAAIQVSKDGSLDPPRTP
jgi:poly-gamma-glutamate capsule biosynthesis protein CapA/YwtB (metallophosphatase superfamily)